MASRQKGKKPAKKRKAESGSEDEESKSELDPTAELPCALDPILLLRTEGIWLGGGGEGGEGGEGGDANGVVAETPVAAEELKEEANSASGIIRFLQPC